ncbi:MAG: sugar transferase [Ruminococcaceae bacterium]|nr:sugar transferase [Oscillospiraceae bacterium]
MENIPKHGIYFFFKRFFDIFLSILALLVVWPVMLIIALLVRRDGGKAFYAQTRMGKGDKPFSLYKFRSMMPNAERLEDFLTPEEMAEYKKEYKLVHDPRVTPLGHKLRKSSLDELPQLFNILRGDMSIVGPRPLLDAELKGNYTLEERARLLSVRPGLTGYWQAVARNESSYKNKERQQQELYYIGRVSLGMDIKILFMTVKRVFSGKGAV